MKLRLVFSVFGLIAAALVFGQVTTPKYKADRILVQFKPYTTSATIQAVNAGFGGSLAWFDSKNTSESVRIPSGKTVDQAIAYYSAQPSIKAAAKSMMYKLDFTPNDPSLSQQYGLFRINALQAWDFNKGSAAVKIAIIDTGIQMDHPDLAAKIVDPKDIIDGDNNPTPSPGGDHGTHCAGIAAANTNNAKGIAGTGFNCKVMPIRVFAGETTSDDLIIPGIRWAIDHGAKVISMSIGGYGLTATGNPIFQAIIDEAWANNIVIVCSAGNDGVQLGPSLFHFPSDYNHVVCVGATDSGNAKAFFTNFGNHVDVGAPGVDILSCLLNSTYGLESGTSMSTPMVAGVIGVMWSAAPANTTNSKIVQVLETTCKPIGSWLNFGLVDMNKAVHTIGAVTRDLGGGTSMGAYEGSQLTDPGYAANLDGQFFRLGTVTVAGLGQVASNIFRYNIGSDVSRSQVIEIDLTEVSKFANSSTGQAYLFNYSTGKWDIWKSFALASTVKSNTAALKSSFTTYISAAGEFRILVRGLMPSSIGVTGNTFDLDLVNAKVLFVTSAG